MFFDYSGHNSCYRGISVDNRFRPGNEIRPGGIGCCDDHHDKLPDDQCCNNCPEIDTPDDSPDCCTEGVMAVLSLVMRTLGRNDTVDVEITLTGGYTQVITLGRGTSTLISGDMLRTVQGAISLCEITRIRLLSSSLSDPEYMQRLQKALERFIGTSMRRPPAPSCFEGDCDSCVEAMQRYIMRNSDNIESLLFDSAQSATVSAISGTSTASVLTAASLTPETESFVSTAELSTDTVEAVTAVAASSTEIVSGVELLPSSLVSAVTETTASVSAPVTVTETAVTGSVDATAAADFAADLTVTDASVVGSITSETAEVINGFSASATVNGVVSGLSAATASETAAAVIPLINSTGTGALQIVIPAGAFGTDIPPADITLPVTVGGVAISYGGSSTIYALSSEATVLGITGTPAVSDITLLGTPTTADVVASVTPTQTTVAGDITFETVNGSLVTSVEAVTVGSASQPESVQVVSSVTPEFSDINSVGDIATVAASDLFSVDTAAVISAAQLDTVTAQAVTEATITTASTNVISSITTEPVNVQTTTYAESIDGEIIGARRGIIAVDNSDGDISVYSSCSVKGAQLESLPQP